jgi:hypothetical protein
MNRENKFGLKELLAQFKEEGINPQLKIENFTKDYHALKDKKAPIFVQVLMFVGALLAALFFLGFLAALNLFDSEIVVLFLGVIIIIGALILPYQTKQAVAIEPLGLAILIVGCSMAAFGLVEVLNDAFGGFLIVSLILSTVVLIVAGSHLQKVSAVLCANLSLLGLIMEFRFPIGFNLLILTNAVVVTVLWLKEPDILSGESKLGQWYGAILNGCSVSLLAVLCVFVNSRYLYQDEVYPSYWWILSILLVALVLWTLNETLDLIKEEKKKIPVMLGMTIALIIIIKAPGIIAGILLLFLGIYSGYRLFAGQGLLAIFFFTMMFYYNMNTTLLLKSMLMVASGLIFLAIGYGLKKLYDQTQTLQ